MRSAPVATVAVLDSPFGPIHLAVDDDAVIGLQMRTTDEAFVTEVAARSGGAVESDRPRSDRRRKTLDRARRELDAYGAGRLTCFSVPVRLDGRSTWDTRILGGVGRIPYGRVSSYGRVATAVGARGAARAAGGAIGRNPIGLLIPCHRVIAGDGSLGGYGGGWFGPREELLALKRALLAHEGVEIPTTRLVDP